MFLKVIFLHFSLLAPLVTTQALGWAQLALGCVAPSSPETMTALTVFQ